MTKRQKFYRSDRWVKFLANLKDQRADESGMITCAICGQSIVKKYDCIGHHKIELTEENVDDVNIALNPDNIDLIHFKCHNKVHNRFVGGYMARNSFKAGSSKVVATTLVSKQKPGRWTATPSLRGRPLLP